jgi:hypothetical protein
MPNKISKAKRTNKGRLTCSICYTWAWSSSHSNSTFFFTLLKAFFSFRFCLACGLLKIWAFIAWWFCYLCRNPSFGFATKAKGLQGYGPRGRKPRNQGKGVARVRAKRKPGSHITYSRECKKVWRSVREWTLTLPRQLPLWEMESRWTPKTSECDLRGQNSMSCDVLYIIGKLLKRTCLKWARITHLDIWNISYGQKKGRESNC